MPFYRYSANSNGKMLEGTVQANSPLEAIQSLGKKGLAQVRIIEELPGPPAPMGTAAPQRRQQAHASPIIINAPTAAASPVARPAPTPAPVAPATSASAAAPRQIRTKRSTDKEIFFIFAQLSEQLRAGINPAQTFGELARMSKNRKFVGSFQQIADAVVRGQPMSDVMALYPDLYPEHVVGLIRAGEVGGFLPDAALTVSQQAENAWKFKRWHWWTWLVSWNFILTIPGCMLVYQGWMYAFNRAWEDMDQGQNNFMKFIGKGIIWPYGPATLLLILLWYLSRYVIGTRPFNKFRHELVMATPMLAKRTRNENMTIFSWTMGRLAHSGVPPYRAWPLAAESVPNLAMRSRLENAGESMREGVKMSEVVFHSKLFPEEYAPLVATGELTGDMASTLERLSNVSRTEYEVGTTSAKLWNASIGCAAMIVASGLILIVIAKMTADPATKVMDEMTQDQPTHSAP